MFVEPTDDQNQNNEPDTRRDIILASMDAIETGDPGQSQGEAAQRARDEAGRFAPKATEPADASVAEPAAATQVAPAAPAMVAEPAPAAPTLTTWRKEYLPIQQKLAEGLPLTAEEAQKLAAYNVQREKEYSTGVSTYRAEAQRAQEFTQAMAEFMPTLQQHNLNPAQWIQNLGRAHHTLAMGSPEQKLQMFARLAQDYGVPMAAIQQTQGGQVDPLAMQLMQELQVVNQRVQGITSWREQQEQQAIAQELSKFNDASKYPHFDQVRESMAQLLERGFAQSPDDAYAKAVRLDEGLFAQEQQRQAAVQTASTAQSRQAAVTKARGAAVQVRTATPSGTTSNAAPKDRRSALAAALEESDSGRV